MFSMTPLFRCSVDGDDDLGVRTIHYDEGVVGYAARIDFQDLAGLGVSSFGVCGDLMAWTATQGRPLTDAQYRSVLGLDHVTCLTLDEANGLAATVAMYARDRLHDFLDHRDA